MKRRRQRGGGTGPTLNDLQPDGGAIWATEARHGVIVAHVFGALLVDTQDDVTDLRAEGKGIGTGEGHGEMRGEK